MDLLLLDFHRKHDAGERNVAQAELLCDGFPEVFVQKPPAEHECRGNHLDLDAQRPPEASDEVADQVLENLSLLVVLVLLRAGEYGTFA